jgi:16S rRNA (adenine1518-N6/adenine1519-N6)-dimethyltransferase
MKVKFDQHFMKDNFYLDLITESANIKPEDIIFEIGPGHGDLTRKLLELKPEKVISCELDIKLLPNLDRIAKKYKKNFEFVMGNGLVEFDNFKFTKLVANIPYSITEPLYKKLLDSNVNFALMLHGIDFYKNMTERETRWNFFVNAFFDVELIDEVPGEEFTPKTKVVSGIVRLFRKPVEDLSNEDKFYQTVWNKKDRNTKNCLIFSLVDGFNLTKRQAKGKVLALELDEDVLSERFEKISNENMVKIFNNIF